MTNRKLDTNHAVFFYEQEFYVLSNFSAFRLTWQGLDFDTSEHAYHWHRFWHDGTRMIAAQIRSTRSAHEAFQLAQANKSKQRPDWDEIKVETVMLNLLRAKAEQHEYVRRKLLQTGERELIEDSWRDSFWGWGPDRTGKNMLGRLWMRVRDEQRRGGP